MGPSAILIVSVLLFFVYVGVEAVAGQWSYSLFTTDRGMSAAAAGVWVAVFWGCLTAGRLALGVVADRVAPSLLLDASVIGVLVATALYWWNPGGVGGPTGLALLGLSLAAIFPTLIGLTPARMGADRASPAIGYQVAAAALGGAVIPAFTGVLIDASSLAVVGPVLVVTAVAMAGLHAAAAGYSRASAVTT